VAHRLSALRQADIIVVLERGRIVQAGQHDQLMQEKGHYQDVAALQVADTESARILKEQAS
jgi:ABC-type multidrug transport system fused ATPase/permease subunit